MNERVKTAFEFAKEATTQLITLSTGVLALTITFASELRSGAPDGPIWLLGIAWGLYVLSIVCGVWTLLAITGTLGRGEEKELPCRAIYDGNIRVASAAQIALFLLATMAIVAFAVWASIVVDRAPGPSPRAESVKAPDLLPISEREPAQAIAMARTARVLDRSASNLDANEFVESVLRERPGVLKVNGWGALRVDEQNWVVSFTFTEDSVPYGWWLDVNLPTGTVRYVGADPTMKQAYETGTEDRYSHSEKAELSEMILWTLRLQAFEYRTTEEALAYLRTNITAGEPEVWERSAPDVDRVLCLRLAKPMWSPYGTITELRLSVKGDAVTRTAFVNRAGTELDDTEPLSKEK